MFYPISGFKHKHPPHLYRDLKNASTYRRNIDKVKVPGRHKQTKTHLKKCRQLKILWSTSFFYSWAKQTIFKLDSFFKSPHRPDVIVVYTTLKLRSPQLRKTSQHTAPLNVTTFRLFLNINNIFINDWTKCRKPQLATWNTKSHFKKFKLCVF